MERISINLLPVEFTQEQVKNAKFYKIQARGIVIILIMIFLASLTIALRILQSHNIQQVQAQVDETSQKVSNLKDKEVALAVLKNRLATIGQYLGVPSKQASS